MLGNRPFIESALDTWTNTSLEYIQQIFGEGSAHLDTFLGNLRYGGGRSQQEDVKKLKERLAVLDSLLDVIDQELSFSIDKRDQQKGRAEQKAQQQMETQSNNATRRVFISHSSKDIAVAKALVDLLRLAVGLNHRDIRCTSIDGYRLEVGADTDAELKKELKASKECWRKHLQLRERYLYLHM